MTQYCYLAYDGKHYKIGKSNNPEERIKTLKTGNPSLELIYYTDRVTEKHIHKLMAHRRIGGEFFNLTEFEKNTLLQYMKGIIDSINHKSFKKVRARSDKHRRIVDCKMTFGKYKGRRVVDIEDVKYLRWCVENVNCKPELKKQMKRQIQILR